jgi:DNA replication protein DnaC
LTKVKCNDGRHVRARCETVVECTRIVAPFVACDACRSRIAKEDLAAIYQKTWERICPERFRKTDTTHADFPRAIYADLKKGDPKQSLFLFGPTGSSKTRVGMLMLKRALLRGRRVGVLWPEQIHLLTKGYDNAMFDRYADYDDLLLDDSFLTACRESKLLDTVKLLLDVRMRHERVTIFTSQIGTEEEIASAKEYGEAKTADLERIKAIIRRLRESCVIVSFAQVDPQKSF